MRTAVVVGACSCKTGGSIRWQGCARRDLGWKLRRWELPALCHQHPFDQSAAIFVFFFSFKAISLTAFSLGRPKLGATPVHHGRSAHAAPRIACLSAVAVGSGAGLGNATTMVSAIAQSRERAPFPTIPVEMGLLLGWHLDGEPWLRNPEQSLDRWTEASGIIPTGRQAPRRSSRHTNRRETPARATQAPRHARHSRCPSVGNILVCRCRYASGSTRRKARQHGLESLGCCSAVRLKIDKDEIRNVR